MSHHSILKLPAPGRARLRVFADPRSLALLQRLRRIAPSDAAVLITGETGTGKEIIARELHGASERRDRPFVALNCGALTPSLVESELFGHERGAFTGAAAAQAGWFEAAGGGTLFLDELGELPLAVQVKLLRVLQERQVVRLGSRRALPIDVRLVAATNVDLEAAVAAGRFRADLYYRLNVARLDLLPLRERRGDILPAAAHFLELHRGHDRRARTLSDEAAARLYRYDWPGNLRQLENVLQQALLLCAGEQIEVDDLQLPPLEPPAPAISESPPHSPSASAARAIRVIRDDVDDACAERSRPVPLAPLAPDLTSQRPVANLARHPGAASSQPDGDVVGTTFAGSTFAGTASAGSTFAGTASVCADRAGADSAGTASVCADRAGADSASGAFAAVDSAGSDSTGPASVRADSASADCAGDASAVGDSAGANFAGGTSVGGDPAGAAFAGGTSAGGDSAGANFAGDDSAGGDSAGANFAGGTSACGYCAGANFAGDASAGGDSAGANFAGDDSASGDGAGANFAGDDSASGDGAGANFAGDDFAGGDSAGADSAGGHSGDGDFAGAASAGGDSAGGDSADTNSAGANSANTDSAGADSAACAASAAASASAADHAPDALEGDRFDRLLRGLFAAGLPDLHQRLEAHIFRAAYHYAARNQLQTARLLGISRNIVRARLLALGEISSATPRRSPPAAAPLPTDRRAP